MEFAEFTKLAKLEISFLYDKIESLLNDGDIDLINDVLYINTAKGDYVINQHSPTKQIWLSSPVSNAGYFDYDFDRREWVDKAGVSIRERLSLDLEVLID